MRDEERRIRQEFERLSMKTPPRMLTELHYGVIHRKDKPDVVDSNTLVGFIDTTTQFSININNEGERSLKCKIILSLHDTIALLEDCVERLK